MSLNSMGMLKNDVDDEHFIDRSGSIHRPGKDDCPSPRRAVYGVAIRDGKLLLIRPSWSDRWELPGGGLENGEDPKEALAREFIEETGYRVAENSFRCLGAANCRFFAEDLNRFYYLHYLILLVQIQDERAAPVDRTQTSGVHWFPSEKLMKLASVQFKQSSF